MTYTTKSAARRRALEAEAVEKVRQRLAARRRPRKAEPSVTKKPRKSRRPPQVSRPPLDTPARRRRLERRTAGFATALEYRKRAAAKVARAVKRRQRERRKLLAWLELRRDRLVAYLRRTRAKRAEVRAARRARRSQGAR